MGETIGLLESLVRLQNIGLMLSDSIHEVEVGDLMWKIEKKILLQSFSINLPLSMFPNQCCNIEKVARYLCKALGKRTLHSTMDWKF